MKVSSEFFHKVQISANYAQICCPFKCALVLNCLRWELVVDIGEIVDHHCLNLDIARLDVRNYLRQIATNL
jgi:hypothetical protein